MKYLSFLLVVLSFMGCKNDTKQPEISNQEIDTKQTIQDSIPLHQESVELKKQKSIVIKQKELVEKKDDRLELSSLILEKQYLKDTDLYILDFHYPLLNEKLKPSYYNFNEYINDNYVDIAGTEASILEDNELLCDTIRTNTFREKRLIDFKIYNLNDDLLSVLFYKENFYSGTLHPSFSFDCMNFDLNRSVFMNFEDFFVEGSEEDFRKILNEEITANINSGKLYFDCWEISADDFFEYKDNFVIDDFNVEYYFDDCVVCPSYTGSYSIKIPLVKLLPVLKKYNENPLYKQSGNI